MPYTHTNYLQFRALVANRLSDPAKIFWTDTEIKRYCLEALRTWNSMAWYSRDRGEFQTISGVIFYDIPANLRGGQPIVNLLSYNLLDQDIYTDMKYALLQNASTTNTWTGNDQFDQQSIQDAMQMTRNQFLYQSAVVVTHSQINASPTNDGRFSFNDNIIHFRRAAFQPAFPANSPFIPLGENDEYGATSYGNWFPNQGTPLEYSTIMTPQVSLQLIPPNALNGTLDILTVNSPGDLNLANGVLLNVPDDLAWIVKWGTLATLLLGEGQRNDAQRGQYALQRYKQGIELAKRWNTLQQPMINGVPLLSSTINNADDYKSLWQNPGALGKPTDILVCSPNMIALAPIPDSGQNNSQYSILMDVVRNFMVPVQDTDFIQVGREELDTIVDYTVHLASFKMGGQEFMDTIPLAQNMLEIAAFYNNTLAALAPNLFRIARQSIAMAEEKPIEIKTKVDQAA